MSEMLAWRVVWASPDPTRQMIPLVYFVRAITAQEAINKSASSVISTGRMATNEPEGPSDFQVFSVERIGNGSCIVP